MTKFDRFFLRWIAPICIACGVIGFCIAIMRLAGNLP
jgi:hypothetical protein